MRGYITKNLLDEYQKLEAINGKEGFDKALEVIIADVTYLISPEVLRSSLG